MPLPDWVMNLLWLQHNQKLSDSLRFFFFLKENRVTPNSSFEIFFEFAISCRFRG